MKKVKLNNEERLILSKLTPKQLLVLSQLHEKEEASVLIDITNVMIDYEKNIFFSEREIDSSKLAIIHAYSRGGIAKLVMLLHLIAASQDELNRRSNKKEGGE